MIVLFPPLTCQMYYFFSFLSFFLVSFLRRVRSAREQEILVGRVEEKSLKTSLKTERLRKGGVRKRARLALLRPVGPL